VGIFYFLQLFLSQTLTNGTSQWRRLNSWFIFLLSLGLSCCSTFCAQLCESWYFSNSLC